MNSIQKLLAEAVTPVSTPIMVDETPQVLQAVKNELARLQEQSRILKYVVADTLTEYIEVVVYTSEAMASNSLELSRLIEDIEQHATNSVWVCVYAKVLQY